MRVVMVVPAFPRLSETFIVSKFLGLLEAGVDAHVVCSESAPADFELFPALAARPELRARVHVRGPTEPTWRMAAEAPRVLAQLSMRQPRAVAAYLRALAGTDPVRAAFRLYQDAPLIELRPDLIHFEFGPMAAEHMQVAEAVGARTVVSFRGYDLSFVALDLPTYYDEVWRKADAVHCLGQDLWRRAQRRGCPPDMPHALISPAIKADRFRAIVRAPGGRIGTAERPARVLSVARLKWSKGHDYLLEAVRLLRDQGVHLDVHVVGGGPAERPIRFGVHQLALEDSVTLRGALPPAEVTREYEWADIFVHPSVAEGFCNAVIEAQAAALPVVCSDADGLPENIEHGGTGYVVPRRDSAALAARIAELCADGDLRHRMGERGRARVDQRFRLEDQISAFLQLYRDVLATPARGET